MVLTATACGLSPSQTTSSTTTSTVPSAVPSTSTTTTAVATTSTTAPWVLGATPLPLGPHGDPEVLPTPPQLVDRRIATVDRLPPPSDGAFHASIEPIDDFIGRLRADVDAATAAR